MQFSAGELVKNLSDIVHDINERTYVHSRSSCFGILYPTAREIYAAQFRDRVIQHFYIEEIEDALNQTLVYSTTSCRTGKGTDYALCLLNKFLTEESDFGRRDCFYWKVDLSGYFISIWRKKLTRLMTELIEEKYHGPYFDDLIYLTPKIYENNPAKDRIMRMTMDTWLKIPERKRMNPDSEFGLAIGNITAQHGSNMNLNAIDHLIMEDLNNPCYVRYVDDMIVVNQSKEKLMHDAPIIEAALNTNGQKINHKKTILDTAYHGVKFLGKVSYPYGYQKPSKASAARVIKSAKELKIDKNLLSKLNSQTGRLRHYASHNLLMDYIAALPKDVWNYVTYNKEKFKFERI